MIWFSKMHIFKDEVILIMKLANRTPCTASHLCNTRVNVVHIHKQACSHTTKMNVSLEKWLSRERLLIQPQRSSQVGFVLAKYLEHEISYPKGRLTNSLFRGKKAFLMVAYWLLTDKWKRFDMIARDDGRKSQTEKKYMCALRWRVLSIWSTFLLWYLLVFYISPRSMKWQYNVRVLGFEVKPD